MPAKSKSAFMPKNCCFAWGFLQTQDQCPDPIGGHRQPSAPLGGHRRPSAAIGGLWQPVGGS